MAQTEFEKIEVGTLLTKAGIKLGVFGKPIPLPDGEWQVVNKRIDEIPLTSNRGSVPPAKNVVLTLKNSNASESPIFAIVMSFTPDPVQIRYGNSKCANTNTSAMVDDFGLTPDSMGFVCGTAWSLSKFKNRVAKTAESTSKWDKDNLTALSAYPEDIPDNVLQVGIWGNQDKGRMMSFYFFIKRDGDYRTDPNYAQYAKDWMHGAGMSLSSILKNDATTFALPTPFVAQTAQ